MYNNITLTFWINQIQVLYANLNIYYIYAYNILLSYIRLTVQWNWFWRLSHYFQLVFSFSGRFYYFFYVNNTLENILQYSWLWLYKKTSFYYWIFLVHLDRIRVYIRLIICSNQLWCNNGVLFKFPFNIISSIYNQKIFDSYILLSFIGQ